MVRGASRSDGTGGSGIVKISDELAAVTNGPSNDVLDGAFVGAVEVKCLLLLCGSSLVEQLYFFLKI